MREDRALATDDSPALPAPSPRLADHPPAAKIDGTVDLTASALRFVYAFTFDGSTLPRRAEVIEQAAWQGARQSLKVWQPEEFPSADLLSHVAAFLRPPADSIRTAALWRMDEAALRSPAGLGGGADHPGATWTLVTRHSDIPFVLHEVSLALFRHGVGFLTIAARPTTPSPDAWFDFLHHFRFISGQRAAVVRAERALAPGERGAAPTRTAYFPAVAGPDRDGQPHNMGEIVDGLLRAGTTGNETNPWWEEVFVPGTLLPYASLFVDGCEQARADEMLFRLRNFFHANQDVHPAVQTPDDPQALPYSEGQWFFFSLNGGGFLARNAPATPFFRQTLPAHIAHQYFLLFLLALQQRFVLMMLSQEVSRRWVAAGPDISDADRVAAFARIRDALLAFTAQGYFAQTMQEEHHHRCYERWQQTFQLARLYDEVSAEVREMFADLDLRQRHATARLAEQQERQSKMMERRLNLIGFLVGVPVWLFVLINSSVNLSAVRSALFRAGPSGIQWYDLLFSVGLGAIGIGLALILYRMLAARSQNR